MPPTTMTVKKNFGGIIDLITEGLLVRIRLFWRDNNEALTNFLCLRVTTNNLGNTRETMPRRMHYLDIWANDFTWLRHGDLWKARFTHNRLRTRVGRNIGGCTNSKMSQKLAQMNSYTCRLWMTDCNKSFSLWEKLFYKRLVCTYSKLNGLSQNLHIEFVPCWHTWVRGINLNYYSNAMGVQIAFYVPCQKIRNR